MIGKYIGIFAFFNLFQEEMFSIKNLEVYHLGIDERLQETKSSTRYGGSCFGKASHCCQHVRRGYLSQLTLEKLIPGSGLRF